MKTFDIHRRIKQLYLYLWLGIVPCALLAQSTGNETFNASAHGSDYYLYFEYSGLTNYCPCENENTVKFYYKESGRNKTIKTVLNAGNSGRNIQVPIGPGTNRRYYMSVAASGKQRKRRAPWRCTEACSGSGSGGYRTRGTVNIKPPKSLYASQDELDFISVRWEKGTDIPANDKFGYLIYKGDPNSPPIDTLSGDQTEWIDTDITPDKAQTYYIRTYSDEWGGGHLSTPVFVEGKTKIINFQASDGDYKNFVQLTWEDISDATDKISIYRDGTLLRANIPRGDTYFKDDLDPIPGFHHEYTLAFNKDGQAPITFPSLSNKGYRKPNGLISGKIRTPSGVPIKDAKVFATLQDSIRQGNPDTTYSATTDESGFYEIPGIYYDTSAKFNILAQKEGHSFEPMSYNRTLNLQSPVRTHINFTDTTSFTISGQITQLLHQDICGIGEIEILVNGIFKGDKTDENGYYSIIVDEAGVYEITPRYKSHRFSPKNLLVGVDANVIGADFDNIQMGKLAGYVTAGCNHYIGSASLRILNEEGAEQCIDTIVQTVEGTGYYEVILPSRAYHVEVLDFNPTEELQPDSLEILRSWDVKSVDLSDSSQTLNFIYHKPPKIQLGGLDSLMYSGYDYPILEQGETYSLEIGVWEILGECLSSEGTIVIEDQIGTESAALDTLLISNGRATYEFTVGSPNLTFPYLKKVKVLANVGGLLGEAEQEVLVTGIRPREQTFSTVTPSIPFTILRDPPGDKSFSYLTERSTSEIALNFSGFAESSLSIWKEIKAGVKFEAGVGVSTESKFWGSVKNNLSISAKAIKSKEYILSITNAERFSTSNNESITGQGGDVFVGAALNLIYALTDEIKFDFETRKPERDTSLIVGNDGFATTFMYTEGHIKDHLIPNLHQLKELYEQMNPDSSSYYQSQIHVWQQMLQRNEELKERAQSIENRSFSANAEYQSSRAIDITSSTSLELYVGIERSVAVQAGFEVGGSGISGGAEIKMRLGIGSSKTETTMKTRETGYILNDDDLGDVFSVNIKEEPVYGTIVVETVSGVSSCPAELNTQYRDGLSLTADHLTEVDIAPDAEAVFKLFLTNLSESDEIRTYNLRLIQSTNPDGAKVTIGGSPALPEGIDYAIAPYSSKEATITIKRGPRAFSYEGLTFEMYSPCDPSISKRIALSAFFQSSCSPITLATPQPNWVHSSMDGDELTIVIQDYQIEHLDQVRLQYARKNSNTWKTLKVFEKSDLDPSSTRISIDLTSLTDGKYVLRLQLDCESGFIYSSCVPGVIDRRGPEVYGIPKPSDGQLDLGDEISITFNELIDCSSIHPDQITLIRKSDYQIINADLLCNSIGDQLTVIPDWDSKDVKMGDLFEIGLSDITDIYGNMISEPIFWSFRLNQKVSSEDTVSQSIRRGKSSSTHVSTQSYTGTIRNKSGSIFPFNFLNLYPNPSTGKTFLELESQTGEEIEIEIFDYMGRKYFQQRSGLWPLTRKRIELNLTNLPSNLYIIRITQGENSVTKKVLIVSPN